MPHERISFESIKGTVGSMLLLWSRIEKALDVALLAQHGGAGRNINFDFDLPRFDAKQGVRCKSGKHVTISAGTLMKIAGSAV